ncbi:meiosis 1 arrest protein-like [Dendronephthya gigantea]|uniref:meiosis 1 arrest protein-like n=1 Tax=Dendronephthya gigantea TaxID=151771 RepID=UPI00106A4CFB|nr:meiosis 1 arrest protein-like [Dendronephthya gigantea]
MRNNKAHVLILDISQPFNHDALVNVYQSLTDFLSLVTHISGPLRVPLLGLTTIGQYAETIFPLQPTKGNFSRLYMVTTEFKRSAMDTPMPVFDPDSLIQGFKNIILQYQRQQQTFRQVKNSSCQLEISILSCQPSHSLSLQVNKLSQTLDLNCLKKVQVLNLRLPNSASIQSELNSSISPPGDGSDHSNETLSDIVDIANIENNVLSLMNYFKTWLKDCGTDSEAVHIILPANISSSPDLMENNFGAHSNEMVLKCDLHESLIDPLNLLCGEYFTLKGDYNFLKSYSESNKAVNMSQSVNKVYRLRAFSLVKKSGVCESVLYGMPMFVRPTCCWKLDWDELDSNQQDFNSLCKVLNEKELSLILKSETDDANNEIFPQAHYLVMASSNSTLLIKPVVMEELMLPSNFPSLSEKTSQQSTEVIAGCLDLLPVQDVYNPFFMKSNLFKFFISKTLKNNRGSRGGKRKFQAPQRIQGLQSRSSNSISSENQGVGRQTNKRVSFQSPRTSSHLHTGSRNTTTSTQKRARTLSTVAVLEPNPKYHA